MTAWVVFLALASLILTGCTITDYKDLPRVDVESPPLPEKDITIYYRVDPVGYYRNVIDNEKGDFFYYFPPKVEDFEEFDRVFRESGVFSEAVPASVPPDRGLYCAVEMTYLPLTETEKAWLQVSQYSATILPSYNGNSGYLVHYHLYLDAERKKSYQYNITKKQMVWFVLFPLAWVNALTYDLDEAFRATAFQFFTDAALDGYLSPVPPPASASAGREAQRDSSLLQVLTPEPSGKDASKQAP